MPALMQIINVIGRFFGAWIEPVQQADILAVCAASKRNLSHPGIKDSSPRSLCCDNSQKSCTRKEM